MRRALTGLLAVGLISVACGGEDEAASPGSGGTGGTAATGGSGGSAGSAGSGAFAGAGGTAPVNCESGCESWCDGSTWPSGSVPTAADEVVIAKDKKVLVDCDAEAKRVVIEPGGALVASREVANQLTVHGNLEVYGRLDYGSIEDRIPNGVTAEIVFVATDDNAVAGTPSTVFGGEEFAPSADTKAEVLSSDIGLWVMGPGTFTASGAPKLAWSKLSAAAAAGQLSFQVEDASGWQPGDKVMLTPTAMRGESKHIEQFDEGVIESVDGNTISVQSPLQFDHAGCTGCMRRGEAANLSRNVVIRSADDSAHAHAFVADEARVEIDSAELRWLGPEWGEPSCGGPDRRAALYFHQQDDASRGSFVRHAAIWGGDKGFIHIERSHGIEVVDVAGYDTYDTGFSMSYDTSACGTRCTDRDTAAPKDTLFDRVLAAKLSPARREEGCLRVGHRHTGVVVSGGEGSGARDSVVTGMGIEGSGADVAGFGWSEGGSGRPEDFTFTRNVAHNNDNHGAFIWHNATQQQAPYADNDFWSNNGYGVRFGAYGNHYRFANLAAEDNGQAGMALKSVPASDAIRIDKARLNGLHIQEYVNVQQHPQHLRDIEFVGGGTQPRVTQFEGTCQNGDETDPQDKECARVELVLENVSFPAGSVPFDFGDAINLNTVWRIRNFSHPDFASLPTNFDLHRRDSKVSGGSYNADFDAWLVPQ